MLGIGSAEVGIILVIVVVLFAPTVAAFLIGYAVGQRKGASDGSAPAHVETPPATVPREPADSSGKDADDE